jgi:hypothetical protein
MTLTPLARPGSRTLAQYLISCPKCQKPAAAHVDGAPSRPVLVRFVCPDACAVETVSVLACLPDQRAESQSQPA